MFTFIYLQQVLSESDPNSYSVIKHARVHVTRVLHFYGIPILSKSQPRRHGTDGRTACYISSVRYKCTLAARRRSKNARKLLVLRAMRRQRRAMYVIFAICES